MYLDRTHLHRLASARDKDSLAYFIIANKGLIVHSHCVSVTRASCLALSLFFCASTQLAGAQPDPLASDEQLLAQQLELASGVDRIRLLIELGKLRAGDTTQLKQLAREALQLIGDKDLPAEEAEARILRCKALQKEVRFAEARREASRAIDLATRTDEMSLLGRARYAAAVTEYRDAEYEDASEHVAQAIKIQAEAGMQTELSSAYTLAGAIARSQGNLETAVSNHLEALRIGEELDDVSAVARSKNNLGLIYWNLGRLEDAHQSLLSAFESYRETNLHSQMNTCRSNLGLILCELDRPIEAIGFLQQALESEHLDDSPAAKSKVLSNLGFAHEVLENDEKALAYYEKALAIRVETNDKKGLARTNGAIGGVYQRKDDHTKAISYLEKALSLAREIGARTEMASLLRMLSESKEALGNTDEGLANFKEYHQLQMELTGPEVLSQIAQLERKAEAERHARQTKELKIQAIAKQHEIERQRSRQTILIVGCSLLCVCFLLFLGLFVSRARALERLKQTNNELEETARRLAESETKYRLLFESADVPTMLFDVESRELIDLNSAAKQLCGSSLKNRPSEVLVPKWLQDSINDYLDLELTDASVRDDYWTDAHGMLRWTEIRGAAVVLDGRQAKQLNIRDTTELRLREKAALRTDKLDSLGVLAGGIAHDFNNALMGIVGYIDIAKRKAEEAVPELDIVAEIALRSSQLTHQLIAFAEGGDPVRAVQDISPFLRRSVELATAGSRMNVQLDIAEDLFPLDVDAGQLSQVVSNIVINAKEATNDQGNLVVVAANQISYSRTHEFDSDRRFVRIDFRDDGVGIRAEHQERVFEPYWTTKPERVGLGLATAYSIMNRHGGDIRLVSSNGKGTTFTLWLPAALAANSSTIELKPAVRIGHGADICSQLLKILVLEDEPLLRKMYKSMLEGRGHTVIVAPEGEAAIGEYFARHGTESEFDLLIMDLTIKGGMGGAEALAEIQAKEPRVAAIVASGYSDGSTMAHFRQAGFAGAIGKPFTEEELWAEIAKTLSCKRKCISNQANS